MSPSTTPLPKANETQAPQETTAYHELEKEKSDFEVNDESTKTSSTMDAETKKNDARDNDAVATDTPPSPRDYPGGLKLASIVAALVLSIFLFSLDQVNQALQGGLQRPCHANSIYDSGTDFDSDHRSNRHSQDHR